MSATAGGSGLRRWCRRLTSQYKLFSAVHEARRWAGGVYGVATATKFTGPFLVVPYVIFALLVQWRHIRADVSRQASG